MGKGFFDHFEKAWARLSKDFSFDLVLHGAKGDETWAARILEYPEGSQCRSCSWLRANACCGRQPILYSWKLKARGVAIDEAGNMSRANLCSVWGNTLRPCLLSGDEKHLAPVVMGQCAMLSIGLDRRKLGPDKLFQDMAETMARELDVTFRATGLDELKSRSHAIWPKSVNVVAVFLIGKSPLFVDCHNSFCQVDPVTHSKRSWDQIKAAFDFLADFIEI
ncbi:hypothetical protein HYE68_003331 [Fusarium pseudograminearum]|nr:hypothetical protein HYE68_003331 [Fusarium pseudograminearum]